MDTKKTSFTALYAQADLASNQCHLGKEKFAILCKLSIFFN